MMLNFAFSPCPNDTFMFEPIVNERIDLEGFKFNFILDDVENLNKAAFQNKYEISKVSFNAFTQLTDFYQLADSGCALGFNCGPILISKKPYRIDEVKDLNIAIPGINTTAYLLLKHAFPRLNNCQEMLFSEIESAVYDGIVDAGLIIHENRFTYHLKDLKKIIDLGEYWESKTNSPIPLGGIIVNRNLPLEIKTKIDRILNKSVQFAIDNPKSGLDFIRSHAQEMDEDVMFSHINLYVTNYSKALGTKGRNAIRKLFEVVKENMSEKDFNSYFITDSINP